MQTILDNNYLAAIYLRLSKEDGDLSTTEGKTESNSIANQRKLIEELKKENTESFPLYCAHCGRKLQRTFVKKYSPMAELGTFAAQYADALAAGSGGMKKEVRQKGISEDLSRLLSRRETLTASRGDARFIPILAEENPEYLSETIVPILCEGDVIGSVILAGREEKSRMGETEKKLAATASGFLGKQMENQIFIVRKGIKFTREQNKKTPRRGLLSLRSFLNCPFI